MRPKPMKVIPRRDPPIILRGLESREGQIVYAPHDRDTVRVGENGELRVKPTRFSVFEKTDEREDVRQSCLSGLESGRVYRFVRFSEDCKSVYQWTHGGERIPCVLDAGHEAEYHQQKLDGAGVSWTSSVATKDKGE